MDGLIITSPVLPPTPNPSVSAPDDASSKSKGAPLSAKLNLEDENAVGQVKTEEAEDNTKNSPDVRDLIDQLEKLAESLHMVDNTRLSISFREDVAKFVYHGVDRDSGEVVSEFPSEEILDMLARFQDITGLSVDIES